MGTLSAAELRQQRGQAIAELSRIVRKHDCWEVPSQSGAGKHYVFLNSVPPRCSCADFEKRGQPCKHVFAVQALIARESSPAETDAEPAATIPIDAKVARLRTNAERKTYKQIWPAYNKAQTTEKARFQVLLADLCQGVPEPERPAWTKGRKPVPLADAIFAVCFKVYATISGRRFQTDLDAAHAAGHLGRPLRYNTVFDAFENPALTPILEALIVQSALPLRAVEVDFASDSTGFCTSRFVRWFDHKYGVVKQKYDWVKVHLMTGVRTNVITAAKVGGRYDGDCPHFGPLLTTTARNFSVREVSADSAFGSYENFEVVGAIGATPYIDFKSNTTADAGGVFRKMFHLYNLNRDEYLSHYHKRSNVESTASMVKAKFGDHLRSKTDVAMANEALAKILCHNICCLIQSMFELGIEVTFWGKDEAEAVGAPEAEGVDDLVEALAWM